MKKTASTSLICMMSLAACSNSESPKLETTSPQTSEQRELNSVTQNSSQPNQEDITPEQAHEFAKNLLNKIDEDEKFLNDAFKLGEYSTFSKYVMTDWPNYVNKPYSEVEAKQPMGRPYFPSSDVASPYAKCDTALGDLYIYAGVMGNLLKEDTATNRKIYRKEKEDFLKSKTQCAERVNMTYDQAYEADEKE
ncbi:hypothetical protein L2096_12070 [Acinetobacter sp. ACZLY 512]|uniref:hypothetical protein n=1 Tax=Acinetobacter sp. ACZLY 512 TaxID=2911206 RepID=UPI0020273066|nr:hypothetical protein [Acinetobacter sp. ACZLY 512]MCL9676954.1 hypothetical protein [Acinetobacter sp. ACZLY 512]